MTGPGPARAYTLTLQPDTVCTLCGAETVYADREFSICITCGTGHNRPAVELSGGQAGQS